jgi:acyl-CoA reductase-like NAD-dependent aldehyde dehydrogenase
MIVLQNPRVKDGAMAVDRIDDVYVAGRWQTAQSDADTAVINLVTGDGGTGRALVEHELVAKVSFTGSTAAEGLAGRPANEH